MMYDRARILLIGGDPLLLHSRRLVLETKGYFIATLPADGLIDDDQLRSFDLIMLCHSIPPSVANHILKVLAELVAQTPVLLVSRSEWPTPHGPDHVAVSADR